MIFKRNVLPYQRTFGILFCEDYLKRQIETDDEIDHNFWAVYFHFFTWHKITKKSLLFQTIALFRLGNPNICVYALTD